MSSTPTQAARIALVTGASSGIGRAASISLSKTGWTVILSARRKDALEQTASLMVGPSKVVPGDLSKPEDIKALFDTIRKEYGDIWNKIAGRLAEKYTVVITDLRGYGRSSKPKGSATHAEYSKRQMAADQLQVMSHFGFEKFYLVGHDRGGRVAHRLAWDHPDKVKKMMVLDIAPTLWMYERTDMAFAKGYWHWFFLIQDAPGPENMLAGEGGKKYWEMYHSRPTLAGAEWTEADVQEYKSNAFQPDAVHATCEDYRAAATIDLEHDRADLAAGKKMKIPALRIISGGKGMIPKMGDPVEAWKSYCEDTVEVSGMALDCGHYIPEEKPEELLKEIMEFMV